MAGRLTETEKALVARIRADDRYIGSSIRPSNIAEMTEEELSKRRDARGRYLAGLTAHERDVYHKFKQRNNLKIRTRHPEFRSAVKDFKLRMKFKKYILEFVRNDPAFREELRLALLTPPAPGPPESPPGPPPPEPPPGPPPEYSVIAAAAASAPAEREEYSYSSDD